MDSAGPWMTMSVKRSSRASSDVHEMVAATWQLQGDRALLVVELELADRQPRVEPAPVGRQRAQCEPLAERQLQLVSDLRPVLVDPGQDQQAEHADADRDEEVDGENRPHHGTQTNPEQPPAHVQKRFAGSDRAVRG